MAKANYVLINVVETKYKSIIDQSLNIQKGSFKTKDLKEKLIT